MTEEHNIINILLVEDNLDDIEITKRAIKEAKIINKFWVARDGQEALDFLQHKGAYSNPDISPKPGLILLKTLAATCPKTPCWSLTKPKSGRPGWRR